MNLSVYNECRSKLASAEGESAPLYHVKLEKTADKGTIPNHQIFEGYTVWGYASHIPQVGKLFRVMRYRRNDVDMLGLMTTSPVVAVSDVHYVIPHVLDCITFETANSIYRLTFSNENLCR